MKMVHLDLFSGIGGFAYAIDQVWDEVEHIFCDNDKFCQQVIKKHWPNSKIYGDIRAIRSRRFIADSDSDRCIGRGKKINPTKANKQTQRNLKKYYAKINILTGGFPCQPFSQAGKRRGTEDDRYLWPEMLRVIRLTKPNWVIAENVRGLLTIEQGVVFEQVCVDLEGEGYEVQPFVIPAVAVGAPHRRDRVWFVARIKDDLRSNDTCGQRRLQQGERPLVASGSRLSEDLYQLREGNASSSHSSETRRNGDRPHQPQQVGQQESKSTDGNTLGELPEQNGERSGMAGERSGQVANRDNYKRQTEAHRGIQYGERSERSIQQREADSDAPDTTNGRLQEHRTQSNKTSNTSEQGLWEQNWLEVATFFCQLDDELSDWLDRCFNDVIYLKHYENTYKNKGQVLSYMQKEIQSSEIWEKIRGFVPLFEQNDLLSILRKLQKESDRQNNLSSESKEISDKSMCHLWETEWACVPPQRREHQKQLARELADALPQLSYETALEITEIWNHLSLAYSSMINRDVELDGFKLTKAGHRVQRLKSLGNAIVPQVAVEIMKAIKQDLLF